MGIETQPRLSTARSLEEAILLALNGIRFGSVEIIIHDSKIVQIERREKMRLEPGLNR